VILEIDICLCRRFFCFRRLAVGFQLVAAVALFELPCPVLCAFLCQFFGFVCALHAGIILFNGMYLVVYQNPGFLRGAGKGAFGGFTAGDGLFLFLKMQAHLCFACGFVKSALGGKFLLFGDSCLCRVQSVGGFVGFLNVAFQFRGG